MPENLQLSGLLSEPGPKFRKMTLAGRIRGCCPSPGEKDSQNQHYCCRGQSCALRAPPHGPHAARRPNQSSSTLPAIVQELRLIFAYTVPMFPSPEACFQAQKPVSASSSSPAKAAGRISPRRSRPCRTHGSLTAAHSAARSAGICRPTSSRDGYPRTCSQDPAGRRANGGEKWGK